MTLQKKLNRTIGLATGAYDIIHVGHINFLKKAKAQCDYLIVGINTDEIIRKFKGSDRPINTQEARKQMLEAIRYVDEVFIFDTWEIEPVIAQYKPDIYFIAAGDPGEDVKIEVAEKYGSKVVKLPTYNKPVLTKLASTTATSSVSVGTKKTTQLERVCPFYYSYFRKRPQPQYKFAKVSTTDIIKRLEALN